MQNLAYGYDLLGKLLNRSDANTSLSESFTYDTLNRLTSSTVSLNPTPLVSTFTFNAIGNLISKSDAGTYSYPAPGQPRPHGVTSISGGVINTTFSYDAKGNMTSGNGLTIGYTAFNKPATITRGTTSIAFDHDPEHQRYAQTGASGITLYIAGGGVLAERFAGSGGIVQWTNYLIARGQLIGVHIERSDETTATRYFHTDHLGSISVITDESAVVLERLSYDAWGRRRHPDGTPDPAGAITSQTTSGFTGHEQLDSVGLVHMNGRVYDPLLARFGTPDPMTENPFSTQGWNRYAYVGNSPLNFTDPSGYCFMGCFWKPIFKAIGNFLRKSWGAILQIAAGVVCAPLGIAPLCAGLVSAAVTGITSGNLGLALKAGFISMVTAFVMQNVVSAITSGGGFGAPTSAGGPDSWGPPSYLKAASDIPANSIPGHTALAGIVVTSPSIGESLLNLIPGYYFSALALQQFRGGNYAQGVGYGLASLADPYLAIVSGGISVTSRGVAVTSQTLARQGSSHLAGNFHGLAGASVDDVIARVPRGWTWGPQRSGQGIVFRDTAGYERIRIHGPDMRAPLGSNSQSGWTLRVMDRAGNYYDDIGGIVLRRANEGHIPLLGNRKAP